MAVRDATAGWFLGGMGGGLLMAALLALLMLIGSAVQ